MSEKCFLDTLVLGEEVKRYRHSKAFSEQLENRFLEILPLDVNPYKRISTKSTNHYVSTSTSSDKQEV